MFEEYAAFQVVAFVDKVIYGECVEKPRPDASPLHVIRIFDMISIPVFLVTDNVYVKDLLYGMPVVMECFQRQIHPIAQTVPEPLFIDLFESDASCAVYGIYEPYIPVE